MKTELITISARDNRELGAKIGERFKPRITQIIELKSTNKNWPGAIDKARTYLGPATAEFGHLVDELRATATEAKISFDEMWAAALEQDWGSDHCTTFISNDGLLVAHNEDVGPEDKPNEVTLLKRSLPHVTTLDLWYMHTLGGNGATINSHGYAQFINALTPNDRQIGVPRNIISRWLSETANPLADNQRFEKLTRASGYNHVFSKFDGRAWNLESSATKSSLRPIKSPFVHANHYLDEKMKKFESYPGTSSFARLKAGKQKINSKMDRLELTELLRDTTCDDESIFNPLTVATMIIDWKKRTAWVWLKSKGTSTFEPIELDFINN